jgi:hypothetical protein
LGLSGDGERVARDAPFVGVCEGLDEVAGEYEHWFNTNDALLDAGCSPRAARAAGVAAAASVINGPCDLLAKV